MQGRENTKTPAARGSWILLDKLLDDVVERNQAYYRELITLAKVTEPHTLVDQADIDAIKSQCQREFGNITRSMGFLVDNGRTMLQPAKTYQHCLDMAELKISSGAVSYNEAIRQAVRELADSGLKTVDYESGHVDSVDVAARRAVMTGVNQLNAKYREQSMDYLDTDLVEVSAHLGARNIPGPNGWEAHTEWQGKVFRWNGHGNNEKTSKNELTSEGKNATIQSFENDIQIGRSLGAAAFRDDVKLPNGKTAKITEDSKITKVYTFAGYGTKKKLRVADALAKAYDVDAERWVHRRGDGYVDVDGLSRHAELHWFEHPDVGRIKMKVKRYFDNES